MAQPPPPVTPTTLSGRGRSLISSRTILPGEIILSDSPLLLYPSSLSSLSSYCSHCFRSLPANKLPCPNSCPSLFCSPLCLSLHPSPLCLSLLRLLPPNPNPNPNPSQEQESLFLLSAHSLSLTSPHSFSRLLSLHHNITNTSIPLPPSPFPPDLTAALLSIDRLNAFALMQPDRSVRAYGIYPNAALFNHDCLPNACGFDYVDKGSPDIVIRAIHEISEGREVCLSYFPVNWGYRERQERLLGDYGFRCECDRCVVEREWKDEEEEEEGGERMEEDEQEEGDFPHAYFFVKFVCDREECGGTLAPLPPTEEGVVLDVMECNVCGRLKKDEEDGGDGDMMDGGDD